MTVRSRRPVRRASQGAITGAVIALAVTLMWVVGSLRVAELYSIDVRHRIRFALGEPVQVGERIAPDPIVIAIDDRALAAHGHWPWPRALQARLVAAIADMKPAALGVDLILNEPTLTPSDTQLAQAFAQAPVVLPVELTEGGGWAKPARIFSDRAKRHGHINVVVDVDGVVRRLPLFWAAPDNAEPVPAFALALSHLADSSVSVNLHERSLLLNYRLLQPGAPQTGYYGLVPTVSAADILNGRTLDLRGRVALIGVTATGMARVDRHVTVFRSMGPIPGVFLHAVAVRSLLRRDLLKPESPFTSAALLWVACIALGVAFRRLQAGGSAVALGAALMVWVAWSVVGFVRWGLVVTTTPMLLGILLTYAFTLAVAYRMADREARHVRDTLDRYVDPGVVEEVLASQTPAAPGGERRRVVIMFADLRGFTTFTESTSPDQTVSVLNHYLSLMASEVVARGGTIDKFMGDAVMALFGAPYSHAEAERAALACALAIIVRANQLRARWGLGVGIGIHVGEVVVGHVGSEARLAYTAVGDAVNVAARLEQLARPGEVVMTEVALKTACRGITQVSVASHGLAAPGMATTGVASHPGSTGLGGTRLVCGGVYALGPNLQFQIHEIGPVHLRGKRQSAQVVRLSPYPHT